MTTPRNVDDALVAPFAELASATGTAKLAATASVPAARYRGSRRKTFIANSLMDDCSIMRRRASRRQ
jgi:hypothetical protein